MHSLGITWADAGDLTRAIQYIEQALALGEVVGQPSLATYQADLARLRGQRHTGSI